MAARFAVIVPAAGRSTRFGGGSQNKLFTLLGGRPVWEHAITRFLDRADVARIVVAIAPEDRPRFEAAPFSSRLTFVDGGAERVDSIRAALERIGTDCEFVAVHDAARPCVSQSLIDRVFRAAESVGAALPGIPVADTLKRINPAGLLECTVPRLGLYAAQTPQAFRTDWLIEAYAARGHETPTDDAQLLESLGYPCQLVEGSPLNLKLTRVDDLRLAEAIVAMERAQA